MKIKRVLKFYFAPERTEQMIDRQILKRATCVSSFADAEQCAQGVIRLIEKKRQLCMLWQYLDGIMSDFSAEEAELLKTYACCRRPERSRRTSAPKLSEFFNTKVRRASLSLARDELAESSPDTRHGQDEAAPPDTRHSQDEATPPEPRRPERSRRTSRVPAESPPDTRHSQDEATPLDYRRPERSRRTSAPKLSEFFNTKVRRASLSLARDELAENPPDTRHGQDEATPLDYRHCEGQSPVAILKDGTSGAPAANPSVATRQLPLQGSQDEAIPPDTRHCEGQSPVAIFYNGTDNAQYKTTAATVNKFTRRARAGIAAVRGGLQVLKEYLAY